MNKIKLLHPDQAQKIAAGEVIERPCNVIKELIENSIDAGATQITLYIENSGKDLIRIIDNGCGMSTEDAELCFLPHATSKITNIDELENINSFGFRGEALASISAISQVILTTKLNQMPNDAAGVCVKFFDGKVQYSQVASCNTGTDIQIGNLFYNVPVRKKFLKQDETEWNQIQAIFHAFCLSHTNIHFKLFRDNKMILNAPPVEDVKTRVTQMWGNNVSQNLLELIHKDDATAGISFNGYISNHNFWRYGKTHIFLFVNNRWVKNTELSKAIFKGYLNVLPADKSPAAFIFATIDKSLVDINCHPKKEEVRFLKPVTVQNRLQEAIKFTLEECISTQISMQPPTQNHGVFNASTFMRAESKHVEISEPIFSNFIIPNTNKISVNQYKETLGLQTKKNEPFQTPINVENYSNKEITPNQNNFKIIGQLFKTYIILENDDNLTIIDQHAAHERILYERMLKNFEQKDGIRLMFPEIVKLTENQIDILVSQKDFLQKQGIDFDIIGKNDISIKTGPAGLTQASLSDLILEIICFIEENDYSDHEAFRKKLNEHMHSHLACKSAIKAGDELSFIQMQNLIQDLQKTEKRFICVHGRPTTWTIKKFDLEKNFRRR